MLIRAIDFETTAWPEDPTAEICEVGYTDFTPDDPFRPFAINGFTAFLVNPGSAISEGCQKVHGITQDMVQNKPSPATAKKHLTAGLSPQGTTFAAHYIDFEKHFLPLKEFGWICTWRCSKIFFPESPRHKLEALFNHLKLSSSDCFEPKFAAPLHRAGPDSYLCALLVERLLEKASLETLLEISARPAETFPRSKEATQ
ncbi:exonuclease domain-containing protein [Pseudovibrio denitrificans]|uniref:3'-5' exonuclease n=1 Tax=Pseudovibrio denitrificans TaxID=258256 RepID=UPI0039BEF564